MKLPVKVNGLFQVIDATHESNAGVRRALTGLHVRKGGSSHFGHQFNDRLRIRFDVKQADNVCVDLGVPVGKLGGDRDEGRDLGR